MNFASSVAVAVAPGTPGIGNVTTGLPASHDTDVWPTLAAPSVEKSARVGPQPECLGGSRYRGLGRALRTRPKADEPLLHGRRHRRRLPLRRTYFRTRNVFVPGVQPADHLDVRVRLSVRPRAGVLNPLAEALVVGAGTIFRERARLSVHLNRAFALIFKGCDHVAFIMALQHAHAPHPLEEHGLQVFGVRCGCVGFGIASPRTSLRIGCQLPADRENDSDRDPRPNDRSSKAP